MGVSMTYDDVLEPMAAIPQAKNAEYGSAYNLAPGLFGIPAHVRILVCKTDKLDRACRWIQRLGGRAGTVGYLPVLERN